MIRNFQTLHFCIAFSLAAIICLAPIITNFFFDYKRLYEVTLITLILIFLASSQSAQLSLIKTFSHFRNSSKIALIFLVGFGILSSYKASQPDQAFIEMVTLFSLPLIAQQSAQVWQISSRFVDYLLLALILSLFALEIKFFASYVGFLSMTNQFSPGNFFITFDNVRFFNQYQMWLLPIPTFMLLAEHAWLKIPLVKKLLWFIALAWWIMFFTTCGRGVIVSFAASTAIIFFLFGRHAHTFLKWTLLTAVLGFLFHRFLFSFVPLLFADESILIQLNTLRSGTAYRLDYLWPMAIDFIKKHPFLGIGPMHYAWFPNKIAAHPHNSVLQWGAEWGLPALFLALILIFQATKAWILRFNKITLMPNQKNFNLAVISLSFSLFSAMIYSLFCGVIVMPMSHLTGTLIVSLMFAVYFPCQGLQTANGKPDLKLSVLFSFIVISYFYLIIPEAIPRLLNPNFLPENKIDVEGPRFWEMGDISK